MATLTTIDLPDEAATAALGAALAGLAAAGDVFRLEGDLGAGKTTLARGFIRAFDPAAAAPSPTFTLVETYEAPEFLVWHFDLYRLDKPEDVWELGLEEALDEGVVLMEWPERIQGMLADGALTVGLTITGASRTAVIKGDPSWMGRLKMAGIE
ncbi:MAG: tRNA (adenosine(37)-N6)-threonylcarbamoyltransferase complex ATPase subunit type 1 TsaE [Pseudomonadota bacterium]